MDTLTFKTNIDSSASVGIVRKLLDNDDKIQYWYLDFLHKDHLLTVTGNNVQAKEIENKIRQAGFKLEEI